MHSLRGEYQSNGTLKMNALRLRENSEVPGGTKAESVGYGVSMVSAWLYYIRWYSGVAYFCPLS